MKWKKTAGFSQKRLTWFCILVVGTMILLIVYLMSFCCILFHRYQMANRQLLEFRDYYENASLFAAEIDAYTVEEETFYLENAETYFQEMQRCLGSIENGMKSGEVVRELLDLEQLTGRLQRQLGKIEDAMDRYHASGGSFAAVSEEYAEFSAIYQVILDEEDPCNELLLDDIQDMYQDMNQKTFLAFAVLLAAIAVGGVLMFFQIKQIHFSFSEPMNQLIYGAEQVQCKSYEAAYIAVDETVADEGMFFLVQVFNQMVDCVASQIETLKENAKVERELQESRFVALQRQINPHFMFNTLNMLSNQAYLEDAPKTSALLTRTAKMFRFSLDFSGKMVMLDKELSELDNYIYIQKERFGSRIQFEVDIPKPLPDILIPALTIQPLVENAIIHGAGNHTEGAKISIRVEHRPEEKNCRIIVWDNGRGLSAQKLAQVEREMKAYTAQNGAQVGLGNVYMRLKLLWGNQMSMDLESACGEGFSVRITISYADGPCACQDML